MIDFGLHEAIPSVQGASEGIAGYALDHDHAQPVRTFSTDLLKESSS
jgi:hypothetical protein